MKALYLVGHQIGDEGARALAQLSALTSLDVRGNQIGDEGARALAQLSALTSLNVSGNQIGAEGARALAQLSALTSLYVSGNQIGDEGARALLDAWSQGGDRRSLDLGDNGDLSAVLPQEVLETTDARAILAAYRRFHTGSQRETLQPLNEAKLLIIGNEGAGKTSLVRYLADNLPRNDSENPTRGTAIHEKIEVEKWTGSASGVTLNIWDFGGQEIMHGTHQYFLTRRSLYLLVLDARFEDDLSIYRWLRTIRNRGGDSPVIVVINKCDGDRRGPRLDETQIQKDHPSIVGFVRTSCDAGDKAAATIEGLRQLIAHTLEHDERLKHVRDPFPRAYLRVKGAMAALTRERRVLGPGDFERICGEGGDEESVSDAAEQRGLLGTLHDLGVVVAHGLDRDATAAQREITLLDPNWLTGAIYTLLTSGRVVKQNGVLERSQIGEILDRKVYPEKWDEFILQMMQDPDLGLCFELRDTKPARYLIPEALPESGPDYEGLWDDALRFRYEYELLERRLIPRLIVESHRNATQHETRWLTGVVLEAAQCKILVQGDRGRNRVEVAVRGPKPLRRAALNVALNYLDQVHKLNPGLGEKPCVPLPDNPDVSVGYDHLLALEADPEFGPEHRFLPEGGKRAYTVAELLEGVRREPRPPVAVNRAVEPEVRRVEARDDDSSWNWMAVYCGIGAAAVAVLIWVLPNVQWKAAVAGLSAIAVGVMLFVRGLNPKFFYRRMTGRVITGGFFAATLDFSVAVAFPDFRAQFDGSVSNWFYLAWAVIVAALVYGDVQQLRRA